MTLSPVAIGRRRSSIGHVVCATMLFGLAFGASVRGAEPADSLNLWYDELARCEDGCLDVVQGAIEDLRDLSAKQLSPETAGLVQAVVVEYFRELGAYGSHEPAELARDHVRQREIRAERLREDLRAWNPFVKLAALEIIAQRGREGMDVLMAPDDAGDQGWTAHVGRRLGWGDLVAAFEETVVDVLVESIQTRQTSLVERTAAVMAVMFNDDALSSLEVAVKQCDDPVALALYDLVGETVVDHRMDRGERSRCVEAAIATVTLLNTDAAMETLLILLDELDGYQEPVVEHLVILSRTNEQAGLGVVRRLLEKLHDDVSYGPMTTESRYVRALRTLHQENAILFRKLAERDANDVTDGAAALAASLYRVVDHYVALGVPTNNEEPVRAHHIHATTLDLLERLVASVATCPAPVPADPELPRDVQDKAAGFFAIDEHTGRFVYPTRSRRSALQVLLRTWYVMDRDVTQSILDNHAHSREELTPDMAEALMKIGIGLELGS